MASAPPSGMLPDSEGMLEYKPAPRAPERGDAATTAMFILLLVLSLGLLGWGLYLAANQNNWVVLPAGAIATVLVLVAWPIAAATAASFRAQQMLTQRMEQELHPMRQSLDSALRTLRNVEQNTLISERTKRVAYRERERDIIRRAIEEDLMAGDFAGARTLISEMEKSFGNSGEAEVFREKLNSRLQGEREREIERARSEIERLMIDERWPEAFTASEQLIQKYGGDMEIRLLRTRIEEKRQKKKAQLVEQFHAARARDPDEAMDVLRRLDVYLTPEEGQQLADTAKEVFRGRLKRLKDQFTQAMHQHDFLEALRLGEVIKNEFPNSKLAQEVRAHQPKLREAAGVEPEEASA